MNKIIFQGLTIIILFALTVFGLNQINWMNLFRVEKISKTTEEKLGNIFWDLFNQTETEIKDSLLTNKVDSLVTRICFSNNIDKTQIKVHILKNEEVNAFALPNKHLIIYTGLIKSSDNEAELSGVICHEIAHMELNHVIKKLVKEVGLSVLISITTGSTGSDVIKEAAKLLSSTAFDRKLEKEADIKAVDFLKNANIDARPFADFLYKLSEKESKIQKHLTWISTHPESKERAEYIIKYIGNKPQKTKNVLSESGWNQIKEFLVKL